jgi:dipeptidyl aminopeptidase/acylaminoacyl peptidase
MLAGWALVCAAGAQLLGAPKSWTLEAILELRTVSDPELTADGSKVAYVVTRRDAQRNAYASEVWVVTATGDKPQRLMGGHFSDGHPRWSPDGRAWRSSPAEMERRKFTW